MYRTRAEMRDAVRRILGLVPASDLGGKVGDPVPTQPTPTNGDINWALDEAVARLNRQVGISDAAKVVVVNAGPAAGPGPHYVTVDSKEAAGVAAVEWGDGTTFARLMPSHRREMEALIPHFMNQDRATPTHWWVEAERVAIWPGPPGQGRVRLHLSTGLALPEADAAQLTGCPDDLLPAVTHTAAAALAARSPGDEEMRARAMRLDDVAAALGYDFARWWATRNNEFRAHIEVFSYRR